LVEQLPAQVVGFQQMAEAAHRRLVGHRLAAEIDADKTAHRQRIVERLLHRRVRQLEPLLQEVDAQHPLDTQPAGAPPPAWDRPARSAGTAPATDPPAPPRPKIYPAASSWRSAQPPPPPMSAASSPNLYPTIHPAAHHIIITGSSLLQRFPKGDSSFNESLAT